jgi:hypothetical protein
MFIMVAVGKVLKAQRRVPGMAYGLSRTLPTLFIILFRKRRVLNEDNMVAKVFRLKKWIHALNGVMNLLVVFALFITQIY